MLKSMMKSRYDENRTRSANDPVIKAGVMIANLSWKNAKSINGIVGDNASARRLTHAVEHEEGQRIPQESAQAVAERQAETHGQPDQADQTQGHDALEHRRDHVLQTDHAPVEEGQAGRHQQHQRRGRQHPGHIARIERFPCRGRRGLPFDERQ